MLLSLLVGIVPLARGQVLIGPDKPKTFASNTPNILLTPPVPQSEKTMAEGMAEAEILAEQIKTGSKFGLGLTIGFLTGFIGTGIGYFVVGPESMNTQALEAFSKNGKQYQLGFKSGWEKKTKERKRNSFLGGGLLGTVAIVAIIVNSQE